MLNIIYHHTSYSYLTYSPRPALLMPWKIKKIIDFSQSRAKPLNSASVPRINSSMDLIGQRAKVGVIRTQSSHMQNQRLKARHFYSKELLCWRSDLAFLNSRHFFLNVFKALHICWSLVRNNKRIVFVGAGGTILLSAGFSIADTVLKSTFFRDTLPRISITKSPIKQRVLNSANVATLKSVKRAKHTNLPNRTAPTLSGTKPPVKTSTTPANDKDKKQDTTLKSLLPVLLSSRQKANVSLSKVKSSTVKDNKEPAFKSNRVYAKNRQTSKQLPFLGTLARLVDSAKDNTDNNLSLSVDDVVSMQQHYCLRAQLQQAITRRVMASYGEARPSFFSNTQKAFKDTFNTLNYNITDNLVENDEAAIQAQKKSHKKRDQLTVNTIPIVTGSKYKLFAASFGTPLRYYNLDSGYGFYHSVFQNHTDFASSASAIFDLSSRSKKAKIGALCKLRNRPKTVNSEYSALSEKLDFNRLSLKTWQLPAANKKKAEAYMAIEPLASLIDYHRKALHNQDLSNPKVTRGRSPLSFGKTKEARKERFRNLRSFAKPGATVKPGIFRKDIGMSMNPNRRIGRKPTSFYNFYEALMTGSNLAHFRRFAKNPHLAQADLVFFTNLDKSYALANQIKSLGIPSIGIVSGLNSGAFKGMPNQANLADSVSYPILGNPSNQKFVFMIVKRFINLIKAANLAKSPKSNRPLPLCL